ncbi:hypothetical protein IF2G_06758 [Cordyceps javanica]|nr:hypothetical protein IF2G_06758 [Cordyceps javanica]
MKERKKERKKEIPGDSTVSHSCYVIAQSAGASTTLTSTWARRRGARHGSCLVIGRGRWMGWMGMAHATPAHRCSPAGRLCFFPGFCRGHSSSTAGPYMKLSRRRGQHSDKTWLGKVRVVENFLRSCSQVTCGKQKCQLSRGWEKKGNLAVARHPGKLVIVTDESKTRHLQLP